MGSVKDSRAADSGGVRGVWDCAESLGSSGALITETEPSASTTSRSSVKATDLRDRRSEVSCKRRETMLVCGKEV